MRYHQPQLQATQNSGGTVNFKNQRPVEVLSLRDLISPEKNSKNTLLTNILTRNMMISAPKAVESSSELRVSDWWKLRRQKYK